MTRTKALLAAIFLFPFVSTSSAGTFVFEMTDVEVEILHAPDLGARFTGIREVTIRAIGVGGRAYYDCNPPTSDGWYDLDLHVFWGSGCVEFATMNQVPFDIAATAVAEDGNWLLCESAAPCPLFAVVSPHGFPDVFCGRSDMEAPTISRLVITITADLVVTAEKTPWGSMKARYLGDVEH